MTVLGFLVQCAICPQQAVVDSQPEQSGWLCPRCLEVAEGNRQPGTVFVDQIESVRVWQQPDDEYPIGKVRG